MIDNTDLPELPDPPCACSDCGERVYEDEPFYRIGWYGSIYCMKCGKYGPLSYWSRYSDRVNFIKLIPVALDWHDSLIEL